ncbi:MAG: DUF2064 domain-containing protein [Nanoarchaeota archaeon]|nr:DUF2064 domain-containing protein [Nanoarchaeota archaeon]
MNPDKMVLKENAVVLIAECPQFKTVKAEKGKTNEEKEMILGKYEELLKKLVSDHREQEYDFFVAYAPEDKLMEFQRIVGRINGIPQKGADEGQIIKNAFIRLAEKYNKLVVITMPEENNDNTIARNALVNLAKNKIVLKKSEQTEGYYSVIGMNLEGLQKPFNLFDNIPWGTDSVMDETIKILELKGLSYALIEDKRKIKSYDDDLEYDEDEESIN